MATQLEACRLMVHARGLGHRQCNHPEKTKWCAMAKRLTTDACFQIADDALQLHGGYGYLKDYPLERIVRRDPSGPPDSGRHQRDHAGDHGARIGTAVGLPRPPRICETPPQ
jgi:alkylation response protein AidB-like acyl-CoA dehydrogenase